MTALTDFYANQGQDAEGRTIGEIFLFSDEELEHTHNYIQWLFPLPEPSRFYSAAPLLSKEDITLFKESPELQAQVREALARMTYFYQFSAEVRCPGDHNHLRITRILRFLTLIGLTQEAHNFFNLALEEWAPNAFDRSKQFWAAALVPE